MKARIEGLVAGALRGLCLVGLLLVVVHASPQTGQAALIADTDADFSGTQGQDNWFYGFYAPSNHSNGGSAASPAVAASFIPLPRFGDVAIPLAGGMIVPDVWSMSGELPPWIVLGSTRAHPEIDQPAVKRYLSEAPGYVTITGVFQREAVGPGSDDVDVAVIVDNVPILSRTLTDLSPSEYQIPVEVSLGSTIDFVVSPRGNTAFDTVHGSATVVTGIVPEPATLSLLALGSVIICLRRRRR